MGLLVNPKPYRGRLRDQAVKLAAANPGTRIGFAWISDDPNEGWNCHVCKTKNPKPVLDSEHKDAWVECKCGTPFILAHYSLGLNHTPKPNESIRGS